MSLTLGKRGEGDMVPTYEERIEQFRRREVERAWRAGISAYILNEDGSVVHFSPDGKRHLIVVRGGCRQISPMECAESRQ